MPNPSQLGTFGKCLANETEPGKMFLHALAQQGIQQIIDKNFGENIYLPHYTSNILALIILSITPWPPGNPFVNDFPLKEYYHHGRSVFELSRQLNILKDIKWKYNKTDLYTDNFQHQKCVELFVRISSRTISNILIAEKYLHQMYKMKKTHIIF